MAACNNQNPLMTEWNTPFDIPPFDKICPEHYLPAIEEGIRQHNAEIEASVNNPDAPTFENTVAAYELSGGQMENVARKFSINSILYGNEKSAMEILHAYCNAERLDNQTHRRIGF